MFREIMNIPVLGPQMDSVVREALKRYGDFKAMTVLRRMEKKNFTSTIGTDR